jgi:hypothetical protein
LTSPQFDIYVRWEYFHTTHSQLICGRFSWLLWVLEFALFCLFYKYPGLLACKNVMFRNNTYNFWFWRTIWSHTQWPILCCIISNWISATDRFTVRWLPVPT